MRMCAQVLEADELEGLLYAELRRTPQHGEEFAAACRTVLDRESKCALPPRVSVACVTSCACAHGTGSICLTGPSPAMLLVRCTGTGCIDGGTLRCELSVNTLKARPLLGDLLEWRAALVVVPCGNDGAGLASAAACHGC